MAEAVAGGEEALRRNPICACYINVTSPLRHNAESLQKLLFMAGKGLPTTYTPVVLRGVNGPVTAAGAMALANAGELVGLVLAQLKREGAPVILTGGVNDMLDMRTMVDAYADPNNRVMLLELAHRYGLPIFGLGGGSDCQAARRAGRGRGRLLAAARERWPARRWSTTWATWTAACATRSSRSSSATS